MEFVINGLVFGVASDGWRGHYDARDEAVDALQTTLERMPSDKVGLLHHELQSDCYPDEAARLCYDAVQSVTKGWHDPTAPSLMLYVP